MAEVYYKLSHPQKRIWYTEKMFPNTSIHIIGGLMKIYGKVNMPVFIDAVKTMMMMNDSLRMRFVEKDEIPYQRPEAYADEYVDFVDLSGESEEYLQTWQRQIMSSPFQLTDSPLCHFYVYRLNEDENGFLLKIHHIIADGWSTDIIEKQIISLYVDMLKGEFEKPEIKYSYTEYLAREDQYLNSKWAERDRAFWSDTFRDLPENMQPSNIRSTKGRREKYILQATVYDTIKRYLNENGISLPVFFIAVNLLYISISRNVEDIIIGIPIYNRAGRDKNTVGMYTSTMPFRFRIDKDRTINEFTAEVNLELKKYLMHQKYPYDMLVKDIELRKRGLDTLFDTCVNCYNTKYMNRMDESDIRIEEVYSGEQSYPLQFVLDNKEDLDECYIYADFHQERYTKADIDLMIKYLNVIMEKAASDGEMQLKECCLYDEASLAAEEAEKDNDDTVIGLFEQQVKKNPGKYALLEENKYIKYEELQKNVNKRTAYLLKKGLKPGDIVAVLAENSTELIETILAIMKSGGVFLPIDRNYPNARIQYMLMDAAPKMLYTNLKDPGEIFDGEVIHEDDIRMEATEADVNDLSKHDSLAYIIYTSGSTGKPKGVMVSHASLMNYISWARDEYMKENDIFAFFTSISFDLTITSLFTPLASGNTIDVYRDHGDGMVLHNIMEVNRVTIIKMTPSHLTLIQKRDNRDSVIRSIIVGGENLTSELAYGVCQSFQHHVEIINEYGPTEATVGCMIYRYNSKKEYGISVPIGVHMRNASIFIMDSYQNPLPEGCIGEIYIGGRCLAKGYLNNPKLTGDVFVQMGKGPLKGQWFYRTGDIARKLANGDYVYVGRKDEQLKIRGFRIEPAEIMNTLLGIEGIWQAAVKVVESDTGNKLLCAFLQGDIVYSKEELDNRLKKVLPIYMLPSQYIYLDQIPLTANGKIDVSGLPSVISVQKEKQFREAESLPMKCFKEVLSIESVSAEDNFFAVGGDSIKAIQISARLKEYGLHLNINDLMQSATLADAICLITEEKQAKEYSNESSFHKTPIMDWFFNQNFANENYYSQSVFVELNKKVDEKDLRTVIKKLVLKHSSLRINYNRESDCLFYNHEIDPEQAYVGTYDISQCKSAEEADEKIVSVCTEIKRSFDITSGIMLKAASFVTKDKVSVFLTAHHLVVDGLSWRILLEDLNALLEEIYSGLPSASLTNTCSFGEWAEMLEHSRVSGKEKEYWASADRVIADCTAGYEEVNSESGRGRMIFRMETDLGELRKLANDSFRLHMDEVFIIALAMCKAYIDHAEYIPMMIEHHGRIFADDGPDISGTVGWFTQMYPVCLKTEDFELTENIKVMKEMLRSIPESGFGYMLYKRDCGESTAHCKLRFNYMGEVGDYKNFKMIFEKDTGPDSDGKNKLDVSMEVNLLTVSGAMYCYVNYDKGRIGEDYLRQFREVYEEKVRNMTELFKTMDKQILTPSDFELAAISQEDLDQLFV